MKAFMASVDPAHATPRNVTSPSYFCRAASTEGASALHEPQPGAQNHRTVGPVSSGRESTSRAAGAGGAEEIGDDGTADDTGVDDTGVDDTASTDVVAASPPHAALTGRATRAKAVNRRRTSSPYRGSVWLSSRPPIPFVT
jgi:hypothetical protein